jgi:hypothetical protein
MNLSGEFVIGPLTMSADPRHRRLGPNIGTVLDPIRGLTNTIIS